MTLPPSSNRKPAQKSEAPQEPFKRAVVGCMRAMARSRNLDVTFAADKPSLVASTDGVKARLPEPPRKLTPREAAIVRGNADSMALRIACHDAEVHRRLVPQAPEARAVFEAVEQARVEAIGANRMEGVAENLTAMLADRYERSALANVSKRSEVPIDEAIAMIVRERLTGAKPPKSAQKMVDLWRPWVEERASALSIST
jgi:cobaltochelatase CobT